MFPRACATFWSNKTLVSVARSSTKGRTAPSSNASLTFSSCSVSKGKAPAALNRMSGESDESRPMSGFMPPSCRTVCCTVSSCARFQMTPAAFSTTVGCSDSMSLMSRLIAPACAMAKRLSCVSARHSNVPKQFSKAGTKVENSKTLNKKGIPPAFRTVALMLSTADKFHRALAAFSCRTSSVGLPMHWISAFTPPASATASAHCSWAPRFVTVMATTALSVSGRLAFNNDTSLEMPPKLRIFSLQASSTARFKMAPAAAKRASSWVPGSNSANNSSTPFSSHMCMR
mmetsp:Transcript_2578/g.7225  ORF Transcript_2578/g.7225 Transcript_2578/m.7225 type:complete len:287 (+) Transcript_2578:548-1408(+)